MKLTYKYLVLVRNQVDVTDNEWLDNLGGDGWELTSITPIDTRYLFYFKRLIMIEGGNIDKNSW